MQDVRGRFHEGSDLGGSCAALCRWRDVYMHFLSMSCAVFKLCTLTYMLNRLFK